MTDDIVRRLEHWARDTEQSWSDVPTPTPDHPGHEWYVADAVEVSMAREAANEIGRLRRELAQTQEERQHAVAALSEQLDKVRAERDAALLDAEALRPIASAQWNSYSLAGVYMAERDEARREVCELRCNPPERFIGLPHELAEINGWDCYKENTDGK